MTERLENSYFAARKRRIEYRYPFLDVKLFEYYYSLKNDLKFRDGLGRYIFRMAMENYLPDKIRLNESKASYSVPNVMQRIVQDEKAFRELIEEGKHNNSFHYVDYTRLHWMIDQFKSDRRRRKINFPPLLFITPISVLILQKWQREGKIDIGIKC